MTREYTRNLMSFGISAVRLLRTLLAVMLGVPLLAQTARFFGGYGKHNERVRAREP